MNTSREHFSSEESLRQFTLRLLPEWIAALHHDTIPIHIPKSRGFMTVHPGKNFHLHPELFLQLTGETIFFLPEETLCVGPRSICLVPRGMPHAERVHGREEPFANLVFMYNGLQELFFHIAHEKRPGRPGGTVGARLQGEFKACLGLLDEATMQAQHHGSMSSHAIRGLLIAHLALLHFVLEGEPAPGGREPFKVTQARQQVIRLLPHPRLSPSFLARQLQCNADYLSQLFRQTTGMPLQTYINQQRLKRAYELLENSTLNIAQVSEATGFTDPSYFSRAFRSWTGTTPRQHRQTLRSSEIGS